MSATAMVVHNTIYRGPSTNFEPEGDTFLSQTAAPGLSDKELKAAISGIAPDKPLAAMIKGRSVPSNMRLTYFLISNFDSDTQSQHQARTIGNLIPGKVISCVGTSRAKRMLSMTVVQNHPQGTLSVVQTVPRSEQLLFVFLAIALEQDNTVNTWVKTFLDLDYEQAFGDDMQSRQLGEQERLVHSKAAFLYLFGYNQTMLEKMVRGALLSDLKAEVLRGDMIEDTAESIRASCMPIIDEMLRMDELLKTNGGNWRALSLEEMKSFLRESLGISAETPDYCPTRFLTAQFLRTFAFDTVWGMPDGKATFTTVTFPIGGVTAISHMTNQVYYENCVYLSSTQYRAVTPITVYGMKTLGAADFGSEAPLEFVKQMSHWQYTGLYPSGSANFDAMPTQDFLKLFADHVDGKTRFMGGCHTKGSFGADVLANCHLSMARVVGEAKQTAACSCIVFSDHYDEKKGEFYGDSRDEIAEDVKTSAQSSRGHAMLPVIQLISQEYKDALLQPFGAAAEPAASPESDLAEQRAASAGVSAAEPEPEQGISVATTVHGKVHLTRVSVAAGVDRDTACQHVSDVVSGLAENGKVAENSVVMVLGENCQTTALLPDYTEQTQNATNHSFELSLYQLWLQKCTTEAGHDAADNDFDDAGAQQSDLHALAVTSHGHTAPPKIGSPACSVTHNVAWQRYKDNDRPGSTVERAVTVYQSDCINGEQGVERQRSCVIVSNHSKWDGDDCPADVFVGDMYTQLAMDTAIHGSSPTEGAEHQTDGSQRWVQDLDRKFKSLV